MRPVGADHEEAVGDAAARAAQPRSLHLAHSISYGDAVRTSHERYLCPAHDPPPLRHALALDGGSRVDRGAHHPTWRRIRRQPVLWSALWSGLKSLPWLCEEQGMKTLELESGELAVELDAGRPMVLGYPTPAGTGPAT